ncbi:hypothetical protein MNBD_BACTEROID01-2826 [hydrothermal vent metagenome]|uniref:Uncharacterized protein n=1 Tax=hydrothermal vent metagenome TaxID=652676 RepID=A0A3B0TAI3_9ZZZZ
MEYNGKIEVFSNLKKLEPVRIIEEKVLPGSLVFESLNPFPGYYHETPGSAKMAYLYIALSKHHSLENILRATKQIEAKFEWQFDAGKGFLTIINNTYWVLRLRHFGEYDMVQKIQEAYANQGIELLPKIKKHGDHLAHIKIVKFLYLKRVAPQIYIDLKEENHGYFIIPKYLEWKTFEEVTKKVKNNWTGSEFDTASGSFFLDGQLHEFVRVYSSKLSEDYLEGIRELYIEKMK